MKSLNELEVKIFKDRFFLDKTQSAIAKELEKVVKEVLYASLQKTHHCRPSVDSGDL